MSTFSRTELERSLREGRLAPVYLLVGCEGYLRDNGGARNHRRSVERHSAARV